MRSIVLIALILLVILMLATFVSSCDHPCGRPPFPCSSGTVEAPTNTY